MGINWRLIANGGIIDLGGHVVYYLPPRIIVVDVRIDVLPPFQPIVHQHRP